jgi:hypothetical protein
MLSTILTSWKDIARYTGKSVRTLQRWEQELAFPIRRPGYPERNVVIAMSGEIDAWVWSETARRNAQTTNFDEVQTRVAEVQKDSNELLQQVLSLPERSDDETLRKRIHSLQGVVKRLAERCNQLSESCSRLQQQSDKLTQQSRILRQRYAVKRQTQDSSNGNFEVKHATQDLTPVAP